MTKKPTGPTVPAVMRGARRVVVSVRRKRARDDVVLLTVRVTKTDWARLQELAISEGTSMQALARAGLSCIFAKRGLPPVAS